MLSSKVRWSRMRLYRTIAALSWAKMPLDALRITYGAGRREPLVFTFLGRPYTHTSSRDLRGLARLAIVGQLDESFGLARVSFRVPQSFFRDFDDRGCKFGMSVIFQK